jgi:hypothetical protein
MSDATIAARIIGALEETANRETSGRTALVSVNIEMLAPAGDGTAEVSVARKTRTLIFLSAEFRNGDGARIASANSVHKALG